MKYLLNHYSSEDRRSIYCFVLGYMGSLIDREVVNAVEEFIAKEGIKDVTLRAEA